MTIISQSYFTVSRKIVNGMQEIIHEERCLSMSKDKVCTGISSLSLSEIYDMSFRKLTEDLGILYFHTNHGLYPFKVKEEPQAFMDKFYKLKK